MTLRRWMPGDRVERLTVLDDGTWARKGDACLAGSTTRVGTVTARDGRRSDLCHVRFDGSERVSLFLDCGLRAHSGPLKGASNE